MQAALQQAASPRLTGWWRRGHHGAWTKSGETAEKIRHGEEPRDVMGNHLIENSIISIW